MTITAPDLSSDQGRPDDGSSLLADPWTDGWTLPTTQELKAVGWPGARPGQLDSSAPLELVPDSVEDEQILDPIADMPVAEQVEQSSGDVLAKSAASHLDEPADDPTQPIPLRSVATTPQIADPDILTESATPEPDEPAEDPESVIDLTEPKQPRSRTPRWTRPHLLRNRTPKWIRRHLNSRRRLKLVVATVATAYWYFAVATLAITLLVPLAAGWTSSTVMSNSMGPTISAGDVVAFAEYDGALLDQGTIILFTDPVREDSTLTHRVVGLNPDGTYETKGDANQGADSTHVQTESIIGVARMVSPYGGLPYYWLATGQYVWLAAWILFTAAAAILMAPGREPEDPGAQPVAEIEADPARERKVRPASTFLKSRA